MSEYQYKIWFKRQRSRIIPQGLLQCIRLYWSSELLMREFCGWKGSSKSNNNFGKWYWGQTKKTLLRVHSGTRVWQPRRVRKAFAGFPSLCALRMRVWVAGPRHSWVQPSQLEAALSLSVLLTTSNFPRSSWCSDHWTALEWVLQQICFFFLLIVKEAIG